MKALRTLALLLLVGMGCVGATAQIGYQVSLLNTATGEARANENVNVSISLSNSLGEVFYSETKQVTTNDFGVLSLTIGNEDTFKNVDLSKLPFYISVTVNGVMVGRTQILTVPVAEAAKRLVPIDKNKIVGTWVYEVVSGPSKNTYNFIFNSNGTGRYVSKTTQEGLGTYTKDEADFVYVIEGNTIYSLGKYGQDLYYYEGNLYKLGGGNKFSRQ